MLLEPITPDLLDVRLGHDPGRPRRGRGKGDHEVGPWFVQVEPNAMEIDRFDLPHPSLQLVGRGAFAWTYVLPSQPS